MSDLQIDGSNIIEEYKKLKEDYKRERRNSLTYFVVGATILTIATLGFAKYSFEKYINSQKEIYRNFSGMHDVVFDFNNDGFSDQVLRMGDINIPHYSNVEMENDKFVVRFYNKEEYKKLNPDTKVNFEQWEERYTIQPVKNLDLKRRRR